jgi:HPt (histidine-containing phosphotransfer) domain-containing protein
MSAILDGDTLDVLVEAIGAEATRGVVELFIGESRNLVAAIAAPAADRVAIGRAAHSLKSSAGQLGAVALSAAALAVENAAHAGSAELPQLIAALAGCAAATREALAARLNDA